MPQPFDPKVFLQALEGIRQELHLRNEGVTQEKKTQIALELLRQANNTASQAISELSNAFYVYLVAVGVAAPVIAGMATAYLVYRNQAQFSSLVLEFLVWLITFSLGIASLSFFQYFRDLATRKHKAIEAANKLKEDLDPTLEKDDPGYAGYQGVPLHIRRITVFIWSFSFGIATFILAGFLLYRIAYPYARDANAIFYIIAAVAGVSVLLAFILSAKSRGYW